MLKNDSFQWNDQAQAAFLKLKDAVANSPVLALPDSSKPFLIGCDASGVALGAPLTSP